VLESVILTEPQTHATDAVTVGTSPTPADGVGPL
jgi:hypothetical protein